MSYLLDIIKARRSIRSFDEKEISDESLDEILESVKWAPSWANTQCWEVIIVKDPGIKEQLQTTMIKNPATKAVGQAPVVLALCGKLNSSGYYKGEVTTKLGDWFMYDLGIATQNICLTAYDLGLATVIVGLLDHKKAGEILAVPPGYELVSLIPLGYASKDSTPPKRREVSEFIHYDQF